MKSANSSLVYFNTFYFDELEKTDLENSLNELVFENLPIEFKNQYHAFSDLYSVISLYHNAYDSFIEAQKIEHVIESRTVEMGITSTDKAICRINNNLHFLLGNSLFIDEFNEFKVTIKSLMSLIIYKFSIQNNERISKYFSFGFKERTIYFDEIDFYCFIEYFTNEEIDEIMHKYSIIDIPLCNIERVNKAILNLFNYYDKYLSNNKSSLEVLPYQCKIKTCLKLLRYITVSSDTIEFVCKILLKQEFREILINNKILFIDSQIHAHKIECKKIQKTIENTLIRYIDMHIESINCGEKFELMSSSTNINYWKLANYLTGKENYFISKRLSNRVIDIINNYPQVKFSSLFDYFPVINKKTQKALLLTSLGRK